VLAEQLDDREAAHGFLFASPSDAELAAVTLRDAAAGGCNSA
jgi:hypothetical protein